MLKLPRLFNSILKIFKANNYKIVKVCDRANKTIVNSFGNLTHIPNIRVINELTFSTPNTKKVFNYLK